MGTGPEIQHRPQAPISGVTNPVFDRDTQGIIFYAGAQEALRITKNGITANPSIPVDDAAQAILTTLGHYIELLTKTP